MFSFFNKLYKYSSFGFSLIELMVALLIISVLAAVGNSAYQDYSYKAKVHAAMRILDAFVKELIDLEERNKLSFPFTINEINFSNTNSIDFGVSSVARVQFYGKNSINPGVNSEQFMFCVYVSGLNGITVDPTINVTTYSEPSISNDGARSRICMRKTISDGIFSTDCGVFNPSNDLDIPVSYLPQGCKCRDISNSSC